MMSLQREVDGGRRSRIIKLGLGLLAGVLALAVLWMVYLGGKAQQRLAQAVAEGDVLMARLMFLAIIDEDLFPYAPLGHAARLGNVEMGRALLDMGADLHGNGKAGDYPLSIAARHGQVEFMRLLLSHGARLEKGRPLLSAASGCQVETVKVLLSPEFRPRFDERELTLAYQIAEAEGCAELLRILPPAQAPSSTQTP